MEKRDRKNTLLYLSGDSLWGFQAYLVTPVTVLTLLLRRYGAGGIMIGAISAIETGLTVLPQILGNYLVSSMQTRKRRLVLWHLFALIPFLYGMSLISHLAGRLPQTTVRWGLILCFGGYYFTMGIIVAVWMDWSAHLFPRKSGGECLESRWVCFQSPDQ